MKNTILIKLAVVVSVCCASQAFGWHFNVTNWAAQPAIVRGEYGGWCRKDADQRLAPGETRTFNAKECLLTRITGHGPYGHVSPYTSSGQRTYKQFYIIGPVGNANGGHGTLLVGRIE